MTTEMEKHIAHRFKLERDEVHIQEDKPCPS